MDKKWAHPLLSREQRPARRAHRANHRTDDQNVVETLDRKLDEMARADQASLPAPGQQADAFDQGAGAPEQTDAPGQDGQTGQALPAVGQTDGTKTAEEMACLVAWICAAPTGGIKNRDTDRKIKSTRPKAGGKQEHAEAG